MELHRMPLYKLPTNVLPVHYNINIKPDFDSFRRFDANLQIKVNVVELCHEIIMNAVKLNLKKVKFEAENGKIFTPENILYDEESQIVKLFFGAKSFLPLGHGILSIKYDGELHERELSGMYINEWNEDGIDMKDRAWIMTKFDGVHARLELPCWDDPHFKATFSLEIELPDDIDVIFNSVIEKETKVMDGWKVVTFKDTPVMSTWSLAWTIGKFDYAFEVCVSGTKLRFMTPKSQDNCKRKKQWAYWAVEVSSKIWEYFTKTFGQGDAQYPFEKLDFVAIPNYAVMGTGHLGLIQIWENRFWVNEDHSPHTKKQKVALELAKHIAKQWIGHLVTIKDWKQIWLEESLAKFLKYHVVDKIWPEWSIWDQEFTREELMPAMRFDILPTTDPMEITEKMLKSWMGTTSFDSQEHFKLGNWDYLEKYSRFSKGAAIMCMLKSWIGEAVFEKAIVNFFEKHAFKWAYAECFWTELERESLKPIKQIMKTWSEKKGFPIVHVIGNVDPKTGNLTINIKQEPVWKHFKYFEEFPTIMETVQKFGYRVEPKWWIIPMSITTDPKGLQPKMNVLMDKEQISIMIPASEFHNFSGYFKIDLRHAGYMIVNYTENHMRQIIMPMMQRREIQDPMDRFGLLFDVHMLAKIGIYSTGFLLEWIKANADAGEDDFAVWRMMNQSMEEIRNVVWDSDWNEKEKLVPKLNKFAQWLVKGKKSTIRAYRWWSDSKMDNLKFLDGMLIGLLAHFMVEFKDPEIENKAVETFWKWHRQELGDNTVMGDLQKAMFAAAALTNDIKVVDAFKKIYKDFKFEEAREYVLHGIGFFTEPTILEKLMDWAMSTEVNKEDSLRIFKSMAKRFPATRDFIWTVLQTKADYFMKNYDQSRFETDFFEEFLTNFGDDKMALEVCTWVQEKIEGKHCTKMIKQAFEYVQMKKRWMKRDEEVVKKWLNQF